MRKISKHIPGGGSWNAKRSYPYPYPDTITRTYAIQFIGLKLGGSWNLEVERPPLRPIVSGSHHGVYAHTGRLPRAEIRLGKGMCDPNQRETVTERGLASGTSDVCDN